MWALTVISESTRRPAISWLLSPCAMRAKTSPSRSVRQEGGDLRRGHDHHWQGQEQEQQADAAAR